MKKLSILFIVMLVAITTVSAVDCGVVPTDGCIVNQTDLTLTYGTYDLPNGITIYPASGGTFDCNGATIRGSNISNANGINFIGQGTDNFPFTIKNCIIEGYNATDDTAIGLHASTDYTDQLSILNNTFRNNDRHLQTDTATYSFTLQNNYFENSDVDDGTYLVNVRGDHFDFSPGIPADISGNTWKNDGQQNGIYMSGGASNSNCGSGGDRLFHDNIVEVPLSDRGNSVCADTYNNLYNYTQIPGTVMDYFAPYVSSLLNSRFYNNTYWYADVYFDGGDAPVNKTICVNGTGNYHYGGTFTSSFWIKPSDYDCYENITLHITPDMLLPNVPFKTVNNLDFEANAVFNKSTEVGVYYDIISINPENVVDAYGKGPSVTLNFNGAKFSGLAGSWNSGTSFVGIGKTKNVIINNFEMAGDRNYGIRVGTFGYSGRAPEYIELNNVTSRPVTGYVGIATLGDDPITMIVDNLQVTTPNTGNALWHYLQTYSTDLTIKNSHVGTVQTYSGAYNSNITMYDSSNWNSFGITADKVVMHHNNFTGNTIEIYNAFQSMNISNNHVTTAFNIRDENPVSQKYNRSTHFVLNNIFDGMIFGDAVNWNVNDVAYFLEPSPGVYTSGNSYINGATYSGGDPLQGGYPVVADVLTLVNNAPSSYDSLNITATTVGSPVIHYDWYVDGVLNQTDYGETFYVGNLPENTTYNISVFVYNNYGNDTLSGLFTTNAHAPPVVTDLAKTGDNYWTMNIDATVTGTYDYIDWYLNGQFVESGDTNIVFSGLTEATQYSVSAIARGTIYGNSSEYLELFSTKSGCNLNLTPDQYVGSGDYLVCTGTHQAYRTTIGSGATVKFEPGVIIDGSGADAWDSVITLDPNSKLDCANGIVGGWADDNQWTGTNGVSFVGDNGIFQNCQIQYNTHDINTWYTNQNLLIENITCIETPGDTCFLHGGGTNSIIKNIYNFGGGMLALGYNQTIDNFNTGFITLGHPDQCCTQAQWSGTLKNSNLTQGGISLSNWNYNDYYNITNNYINNWADPIQGGNNGQQFFYGNTLGGGMNDGSNYGGGEYITFCIDSLGNNYNSGYNGGDLDLGTCPAPYCHDALVTGCRFTQDTNIPYGEYNVTDTWTQTGDVPITIDCQGSTIYGRYVGSGYQGDESNFIRIANPNVVLKNCNFKQFFSIVNSQADETTYDNISWVEYNTDFYQDCPNCGDPYEHFPTFFKYDYARNYQTIQNSYFEGVTTMNVNRNFWTGAGDYCPGPYYTVERWIATEADASATPIIANHTNGFQNSYQTAIIALTGDGDRGLQGIALNISSFSGSGYLIAVVSTTPDYSGEITRGTLQSTDMVVGMNQIFFNAFNFYTDGQTYYILFQAQHDPDVEFVVNAQATDGAVYSDGEFVFLDNADGNTGVGTPRNENMDLVMGFIYGSDQPMYIPNSSQCTDWDYTNGATEETCVPGMWNADLQRCEDSRGTWNGGNCNSCSVGWEWTNGQWYACNINSIDNGDPEIGLYLIGNTVNKTAQWISGDAFDRRFPTAYGVTDLRIINNTFIGSTNSDTSNDAFFRLSGNQQVIVEGNDFQMGRFNRGMSIFAHEWEQPMCPNIWMNITNNKFSASRTTADGGLFWHNSISGMQNVRIEDNDFNYTNSDRFMAMIQLDSWDVPLLNVSVKNNRFTPYFRGYDVFQSYWAQFEQQGLDISNNEFNILVVGDRQKGWDTKAYNNTLQYDLLVEDGYSPLTNSKIDICNGGIGNTYHASIGYEFEEGYGNEGNFNGLWLDPACSVLNVPNGISLYSYSSQEEPLKLKGNGVTVKGTGVGDGQKGITMGGAGVITSNGIIEDVTVMDYNTSVYLDEFTSWVTVQNSTVYNPYYDYGLNNDFVSLTVPAPIFESVTKPKKTSKETTANLDYRVYTIAEIDHCTLLLNGNPVNNKTDFVRNTKTTDANLVISNLARQSHAWTLICVDKFGNSVSSADTFEIERAGGGGGVPIGQKEAELPTVIDFSNQDGAPGALPDLINAVQTLQDKIRDPSNKGVQSSLLIGVGLVGVLYLFGAFTGGRR